MQYATQRGPFWAAAAVLAITGAATAGDVDLAIDDVVVSQAIKFASSPLVANNVTFVRAIISTPGFAGPVPDVDARMRVWVDGIEPAWSPVYSMNGPITSPSAPQQINLDDHVNFWFLAPESSNVDIEVVVNPFLTVDESNLGNNVGTRNNLNFQCRALPELVYVPINYTPGGGVPGTELIEPGVGDGFVRAIYQVEEWDYHPYPLPPLTWTSDINNSNNALLSALRDIRVQTLPQSGYGVPDFVYGWLPGNPFSGNGQAIGIPGDVAFGNTQTSRHQRTFAHELGHLLDESHNGDTVNQIGIDAEWHLRNTQNLPRLHSTSQFDIMVAGQLTNTAFVSNSTYVQTHGDGRLQCTFGPENPGAPQEMLRVSAVIDHVAVKADFAPVAWIERGTPDADRPNGEVLVIARDADGNELHRVLGADGSSRASCDGLHTHADSLLHALIPASVGGVAVDSIELVHAPSLQRLAMRSRSKNAPSVQFAELGLLNDAQEIESLPMAPGAELTGRIRVNWTGSDPDGDELEYTLLYSPDQRASWQPVGLNLSESSFEFDLSDIPSSRGERGVLRLVATDGLNHTVVESPVMAFGGGNAPDVWVITPNNVEAFKQHSNVILHGFAWDKEDRLISDDIDWFSSQDGFLGTGGYVQVSDLSSGGHTITAQIIDSDSEIATDTVFISVPGRTLTDPDLDNDGTVSFSDLLALLAAWGPCGDFCPADFDLDGSVNFNDLLIMLASWS